MTGEMPSTCIHPIDPHRLSTSCLARVTESTSKTEVAGSNKYKNPEWSILSFPVKIDPAQNVLHLCPHQNQVTKAQGPGQAADCSSLFLAMLKCARSEVERCARSMSMCCSFSFAKHGKQSWKQIWKPWKKNQDFSNAAAIAKERNREYQNPWPVPAQENTFPPLADQIIVKFMCNVMSLSLCLFGPWLLDMWHKFMVQCFQASSANYSQSASKIGITMHNSTAGSTFFLNKVSKHSNINSDLKQVILCLSDL
jgi:hypothetical protein